MKWSYQTLIRPLQVSLSARRFTSEKRDNEGKERMRIGFLGLPDGLIEKGYTSGASDIIAKSGNNTGNYAFWHGLSQLIDGEFIRVYWTSRPEELAGKLDVLVISAANFLRDGSNLKALANIVKGLDIPVLCVGLGAESQTEQKIPTLMEGTVEFLQELSARCNTFGVRGEFSKKVCEHYGIENATVLGCPSIFINTNVNLGKTISKKWNKPISRFATASASRKPNLEITEKRLIEEVKNRDGGYILQRPEALFKLALNEELTTTELDYVKKFADFTQMPVYEFASFLRSKGLVFSSSQSWLDYVRHCSHTVNARIHGTILPMMAEVPSIGVTHDTRTRELVETLKVPNITTKAFSEYVGSLEDLFNTLGFDAEVFDDNRRDLAKQYLDLFTAFGLRSTVLENW